MSQRLFSRLEEIGAPEDVKRLAEELADLARRDALTGLYNRRFFDEELVRALAAAQRYRRDLSLVLFDLDRFKLINDTQGHEAGDRVLQRFAQCLLGATRSADLVFRIGGDEFAVLLPETPLHGVQTFVDRFFHTLEQAGNFVSASFGAAALPTESLFADADRALLSAKGA